MNWYTRFKTASPSILPVFRGTGPEGLKSLRPTNGINGEENVVFFYRRPQDAAAYAERDGGILVGTVDTNDPRVQVKGKVVTISSPEVFSRKGIIPTDQLDKLSRLDDFANQILGNQKPSVWYLQDDLHSKSISKETYPVRENGGRTSLVLDDGTAFVGGQNHGQCWNLAVDQQKAKEEDLYNAISAFTRDDGSTWDIHGKPVKVTKIVRLAQTKQVNWFTSSNYVPLQRLQKEKVIKAVIDDMDWSGGDAYYFRELAQGELERRGIAEDDPQYDKELDKRTEFLVREQLDQEYDNKIEMMREWARRLPIWRKIRVPAVMDSERLSFDKQIDVNKTIRNIRFNPVGPYWSYDEYAAACHWGDYSAGTVDVALEGRITPGAIDWESTMICLLNPTMGDDEKEVRLRVGAKVTILSVEICGQNKVRCNFEAFA